MSLRNGLSSVWAQRYASERFSRRDYLVTHTAGFDLFSAVSQSYMAFPEPVDSLCLLFAFVFTPAVFFNSFFHAGATAVSGVYCPGLITALVSYLPFFYFLSRLAFREGLLDTGTAILALVIAGVFHLMEVGHNVYKAW